MKWKAEHLRCLLTWLAGDWDAIDRVLDAADGVLLGAKYLSVPRRRPEHISASTGGSNGCHDNFS
jgi:hypothetical protein